MPFYLQPTLGGSDINGERRLASFNDYFFRAPNVLLMVWVAATTFPMPSATVRWVVCGLAAVPMPAPQSCVRSIDSRA